MTFLRNHGARAGVKEPRDTFTVHPNAQDHHAHLLIPLTDFTGELKSPLTTIHVVEQHHIGFGLEDDWNTGSASIDVAEEIEIGALAEADTDCLHDERVVGNDQQSPDRARGGRTYVR